MTPSTPPPPVPAPDLREKVADYIRAHLLLSTAFVNRDYVLGHADKILALLPSPAVPDVLTWTREKPTRRGWYWMRLSNVVLEMVEIRMNYGQDGKDRLVVERIAPLYDKSRAKALDSYNENYEWAGPMPEPKEKTDGQ